jgi:hypothetical protein
MATLLPKMLFRRSTSFVLAFNINTYIALASTQPTLLEHNVEKLTIDIRVKNDLILFILEIAHPTIPSRSNPSRGNAALQDRAQICALTKILRLSNSNVTTIEVVVAATNIGLAIGLEAAVVVMRAVDLGLADGAAGGGLQLGCWLGLGAGIDVFGSA